MPSSRESHQRSVQEVEAATNRQAAAHGVIVLATQALGLVAEVVKD